MKRTGAEILIKTLLEQGVDTVFGYPGGAVSNIYDEIYKYSDQLTHIITSHEQGACHAADGYARLSGKVGVVIATSGPGATNLADRDRDRIPGLYSPGGASHRQRGRLPAGKGQLPGSSTYPASPFRSPSTTTLSKTLPNWLGPFVRRFRLQNQEGPDRF